MPVNTLNSPTKGTEIVSLYTQVAAHLFTNEIKCIPDSDATVEILQMNCSHRSEMGKN